MNGIMYLDPQMVIDDIVEIIHKGNDANGFPLFECKPGKPAFKAVLKAYALDIKDYPELDAQGCDCEIVWNCWDYWE